MSFVGFPFVIGLELTLECNICCRHCGSSAGTRRKNELSADEIISICDQFPMLLVQEVDLTGGEPLLYPGWFDIATHLRGMNIPVRMITNGLLLEESIPRLAGAGISTVGVSLDGLENTHDKIRAYPGLFREVISGVRKAVGEGIPVVFITSVNELNISELGEMRKMIEATGVKHWQLQPTFQTGRARSGMPVLSLSSYMAVHGFLDHEINTPGKNGFEIHFADGLGYYSNPCTNAADWNGCPAGICSCGITSDGKIKGCLSMPDSMTEGDLRERDLWSIWFDPGSFSYNRSFTTADLGNFCQGCAHGEQCKGGCSIVSLSATGKLHNDPYCFCRMKKSNSVVA